MAKKKKNKALPLIILSVLLVSLIAGYAAMSSYNAKQAELEKENETVSTVQVLKKEKAILTAFSYTKGKETLAFSYDNEEWVYPEDKHFPVDSKMVDSMIAGLTDIKAVSTVDRQGADVESFGLGKPELSVWLKYSDGSEYTIALGIKNTFNGYQYMRISSSEDIYMMEASFASIFDRELKDYFESEIWTLQNDAVTAADVKKVVIETAGGKQTTVEYAETVELLFNLINDLDLSTWEDHYADEAEMQEVYGIHNSGDRVTLHYNKESTVTDGDGKQTTVEIPATYTVFFGHEFEIADDPETDAETETADTTAAADKGEKEDNRKFFYTQSGSSVVYSADKSIADKIFEYINYVPPVETEAE